MERFTNMRVARALQYTAPPRKACHAHIGIAATYQPRCDQKLASWHVSRRFSGRRLCSVPEKRLVQALDMFSCNELARTCSYDARKTSAKSTSRRRSTTAFSSWSSNMHADPFLTEYAFKPLYESQVSCRMNGKCSASILPLPRRRQCLCVYMLSNEHTRCRGGSISFCLACALLAKLLKRLCTCT